MTRPHIKGSKYCDLTVTVPGTGRSTGHVVRDFKLQVNLVTRLLVPELLSGTAGTVARHGPARTQLAWALSLAPLRRPSGPGSELGGSPAGGGRGSCRDEKSMRYLCVPGGQRERRGTCTVAGDAGHMSLPVRCLFWSGSADISALLVGRSLGPRVEAAGAAAGAGFRVRQRTLS